jgi:hypothetical protein
VNDLAAIQSIANSGSNQAGRKYMDIHYLYKAQNSLPNYYFCLTSVAKNPTFSKSRVFVLTWQNPHT